MRLSESESHNGGRTLIHTDHSEVYKDLTEVLTALDVKQCLNPTGPFDKNRGGTPKRQSFGKDGMHGVAPRPISQALMNSQIDEALRKRGWREQPLAEPRQLQFPDGSPRRTLMKGDFFKDGVFVEVEFGNDASFFRDLFKFQVAHQAGTAVAGVLVAATRRTCSLFDSGVTEYERVVGRLPYMRLSTGMPLWIIGIEPENFSTVQERYEAMAAVLVEHDLKVATWDRYQGRFLKTTAL